MIVVVLCFGNLGVFLVVLVIDDSMGCGGSKADDLPLVVLCRERKDFIKAAAHHRYAFSATHVSYFCSLKDVGDVLSRFVDEELVVPSSPSSPVLTLPSDEGKTRKYDTTSNHGHRNHSNISRRNNSSSGNKKGSSSSTSISHSPDGDDGGGADDSHLHLSDDSDSDLDSSTSHIQLLDSPVDEIPSYYQPSQSYWDPYGMNPPPKAGWGSYENGMNPPPQAGWGSYGNGMNQPPQTGWGSYGNGTNQPPQMGWGSYGNGTNQPPLTGWGSYGNGMNQPYQTAWEGPYGGGGDSNMHAYYMKKSAPAVCTVIHEEERRMDGYSNMYSSYPDGGGDGGFFGYAMSSQPQEAYGEQKPSPPKGPPPPPSSKGSAWDFLNPFDGFDNGYPAYYSQSRYGYGSMASSPDSDEVREREGIPELEEETETEVSREVHKGNKLNEDARRNLGMDTSRAAPLQKSEGKSRAVPLHSSESSASTMPSHDSESNSRAVPPQNSEAAPSFDVKVEKSSSDSVVSNSSEGGYGRKKGVSFEVEEVSPSGHDAESSKLSSLTTLSAHGTRDLKEVVNEIKSEFETASNYGKEVAVMLEVGRLPYQPKFSALKVLLSKILGLIAPSLSSSHPQLRSVRLAPRTMKVARSYGDSEKGLNTRSNRLSSTLEKLYEWEKKLYEEVKGEEKLRLTYEKMCKKVKVLDDAGAESSKIDAAQASARSLMTKLNVCIKSIDAISSRINKLRDEELQPQVTELVHGLISMWKLMLRSHQKQFQAILESKARSLKANTGFERDSRLRVTLELEMELLTWCSYFSDWIKSQRSYVESLNKWLLRCIYHEQEESPDGIVPFSPGRIGAPPIFITCNDWYEAMETISETRVANAMREFASNLRELWQRHDDEHQKRLKRKHLSEDFEKRLNTLRRERGRMERERDAMSDKTGVSIAHSESGVSPLDDLKVDLDSMRNRLDEERARHKEAIKLVHNAASTSLQGGLVPIFRALEKFTSEALNAHKRVRLEGANQGT
ncbi:hypothetical protein RJ639_032288 [Escallonia herrerae]|uniref:DUF632 domain-containing protein n=1 Tax=Escallonia herrerae TaxID=1293975 RepID=A0AA88X9X2_9ASTE|nr:hypothetical protein RJ639_032288 [Escallonia herrerae]